MKFKLQRLFNIVPLYVCITPFSYTIRSFPSDLYRCGKPPKGDSVQRAFGNTNQRGIHRERSQSTLLLIRQINESSDKATIKFH